MKKFFEYNQLKRKLIDQRKILNLYISKTQSKYYKNNTIHRMTKTFTF